MKIWEGGSQSLGFDMPVPLLALYPMFFPGTSVPDVSQGRCSVHTGDLNHLDLAKEQLDGGVVRHKVVLAKAALRDQRDVFLCGNQEKAQGFLFWTPGEIRSEGLRHFSALVTWPGANSLCLGFLLCNGHGMNYLVLQGLAVVSWHLLGIK